MGFGIKRADLQANAEAKIADAMLLLANGRVSNAYYLAGYSVEIALKACISRRFEANVLPDKDFVSAIYKHNLNELVSLAGLRADLNQKQDASTDFAENWSYVARWNEASRYDTIDAYTAERTLEAITNPTSGVLPWIKNYW